MAALAAGAGCGGSRAGGPDERQAAVAVSLTFHASGNYRSKRAKARRWLNLSPWLVASGNETLPDDSGLRRPSEVP
jgi:hypothetical protein